MKNLLIVLLLWPFLIYGQVERSVASIQPMASTPRSGATYAVVIGISDYQDAEIPDLRFADKDAEAFANYLHSPAGGVLYTEPPQTSHQRTGHSRHAHRLQRKSIQSFRQTITFFQALT
jgi:hypothetical protein